jgi:hypothetical protein
MKCKVCEVLELGGGTIMKCRVCEVLKCHNIGVSSYNHIIKT